MFAIIIIYENKRKIYHNKKLIATHILILNIWYNKTRLKESFSHLYFCSSIKVNSGDLKFCSNTYIFVQKKKKVTFIWWI